MQATQQTQDNNTKLCGVPVELDCKNPDCQQHNNTTHLYSPSTHVDADKVKKK